LKIVAGAARRTRVPGLNPCNRTTAAIPFWLEKFIAKPARTQLGPAQNRNISHRTKSSGCRYEKRQPEPDPISTETAVL
jgi:hypothetical protein